MTNKYALKSLVWTAASLPACLFVGKVLEWILKATNPSHVNVSHGLAYLAPILLATIFTAGICWALAAAYAAMSFKRKEDHSAVKLAAIMLLVVMILTFGAMIANSKTNAIVDRTKLNFATPK